MMRDDAKLRKDTPQPTMQPWKGPPSTKRGGAYERAHDTPRGWLWGGDPAEKPNYDPGHKGAKKPKLRKWPY
jgi:hypothetical protein